MRITGYESNNGEVTAITVTDETRGFYDKRFVPERPNGEWLWNTTFNNIPYCKCSVCGIGMGSTEYDFCPNCGADMRPKEGD